MKQLRKIDFAKPATWFGMLFLFVLIYRYVTVQLESNGTIWLWTLGIILGFFAFNLAVRRRLSFEKYFTSRFNPFTAKKRAEMAFDWPRALLFEKLIEVLGHSSFRLAESDRDQFRILATTGLTWTSWGENVYIELEQKGGQTVLQCCSTTLFQVYSWERNEKNFRDLLDEFEQSLTI